MSLYLPEQKLGSRSELGSSSNKFIIKGRQTGSMHRGHTWVFRAESHDTMLAWFEDIQALTEKTAEERSQFVRTHSRSMSRSSRRSGRSASSDGLDDEDEEPFSGAEVDTNPVVRQDVAPRRPQPGGRFPSDLQINAQRGLHAPQSPSSLSSGTQGYPSDINVVAAASNASDSHPSQDNETSEERNNYMGYGGTISKPMEEMSSQAAIAHQVARYDGVNPYTSEPVKKAENDITTREVTQATSVLVPTTYPDEKSSKPESEGPEPHATYQNTILPEDSANNRVESSEAINGEQFTHAANLGETGDDSKVGASIVPESDATAQIALQSVPEADAANHATPLETPTNDLPVRTNRPLGHRTDSIQTISNLDIPGGYPKNSTDSATATQ